MVSYGLSSPRNGLTLTAVPLRTGVNAYEAAAAESVSSAALAPVPSHGVGSQGTNKKGHIMWPWAPLVLNTRGMLLNVKG